MEESRTETCAKFIPPIEFCVVNPFLLLGLCILNLEIIMCPLLLTVCALRIIVYFGNEDSENVNFPEEELDDPFWDEDSGVGSDKENEVITYCFHEREYETPMYGRMHSTRGYTVIESLKLGVPDLTDAQIYTYHALMASARNICELNGSWIDAFLKIWNLIEQRSFCSLKLSLHPTNSCTKSFMESLMISRPVRMANKPLDRFFDLSNIVELVDVCHKDRDMRCCLVVKGFRKLGLKLFSSSEDNQSIVGDLDCTAFLNFDLRPLSRHPFNYVVKGGGIIGDFRLQW